MTCNRRKDTHPTCNELYIYQLSNAWLNRIISASIECLFTVDWIVTVGVFLWWPPYISIICIEFDWWCLQTHESTLQQKKMLLCNIINEHETIQKSMIIFSSFYRFWLTPPPPPFFFKFLQTFLTKKSCWNLIHTGSVLFSLEYSLFVFRYGYLIVSLHNWVHCGRTTIPWKSNKIQKREYGIKSAKSMP